jgi:hypothetical protein
VEDAIFHQQISTRFKYLGNTALYVLSSLAVSPVGFAASRQIGRMKRVEADEGISKISKKF